MQTTRRMMQLRAASAALLSVLIFVHAASARASDLASLHHLRRLAQAGAQSSSTNSSNCGDDGWASEARPGNWSCVNAVPGTLTLHWRQDSNTTLLIGVTATPSAATQGNRFGWVGVGLAEAGGMPGADIMVIRRVEGAGSSNFTLEDRYATQYALPDLDQAPAEKQLVSVEESSAGVLRAVARVPLQPCDTTQDRAIFPGPLPLIYAFGTGAFGYHGPVNRGDLTLTLIPWDTPANTTAMAPPSPQANVTTLNLTMPALPVPTDMTDPYVCQDIELPVTSPSMHLVSFTPLINTSKVPQGVGRVVHHAVIFNCTGRPTTLGKGPYRCENLPENCSTYTLVAAGVPTRQDLPKAAGFRVGHGHMRYVTLQIHYSNPTLAKGLVDASGFQVTLTSALRPHDMGVLTLGWENFVIPPRTTDYSLGPAVCPGACTKRFTEPINVVTTLLHMHKLGASMETQHVRNGSELREFARIDHYQFRYQPGLSVAPDTRVVKPGDDLITTCRYTNPGPGEAKYGTRSQDEMCYSYNWFWPLAAAQGVSQCLSQGFFTGALPICGNGQTIFTLGRLLAGLKTEAEVSAALSKAVEKGLLVYANVNQTMAFRPFNNTPPSCGRLT